MESRDVKAIGIENAYPPYRWVMLAISIVMTILFSIVLMVPSSLITTISEETGWTLGQTGTFNSIVALLMGIFALAGSFFLDRFGPKNTALMALGVGAVGTLLAFFAGNSYALHLAGRFMFGISFGMFFVVPSVVIGQWFPPAKQSLLQGMRASADIFGCGVAFYIVLPVFYWLKTWQSTFGFFGILLAVIFAVYLFFGKDRQPSAALPNLVGAEAPKRGSSGLRMAARNKIVWFLTLGVVGKIFAYNTFTTYLPAFLEKERGYTLDEASNMTGLVALIGIGGGLVMGAISAAVGRRVVMGWPILTFISIGGVIALYSQSGFLIALGCLMIGWAMATNMGFYSTVPVDISGGNGSFIAGSLAIIMFVPFCVAYFVPDLFQALLDRGFSIQHAMLVSLIPSAVLVIPVALIPETGPKAKIDPRTLCDLS